VAEAEREQARSLASSSMRPCIVEFEGISGLFEPLLPRARFVRDRLWEMTSPRLRPAIPAGAAPFIAMHVRRGDLTRQGFTADELDGVLQYTPLSWFLHGAQAVRRVDGLRHLPILICTDGDEAEVGSLLACQGVYRAERHSAITDLWSMSNAVLLFASGFSTFGMWASFLGGMPTLYAPGKIQQRVQCPGETGVELEIGEGEPIPESARTTAVQRLNARCR